MEHRKVIVAASLGALFAWYDFYLYGVLASVLAPRFFAALEPDLALLFALLAFAAGFVVRPLGALLFGRLGDLIGRKYTFLVTLLLMGVATFLVSVLPVHASIGVAAPVLLVALRLLQGLAIGGEYGGVVTYVAEHAPAHRRGLYTGWIQTTATLGLLLALLVVVGVRRALGDAAFEQWGWRVPFALSIVLLALSVWMRWSLKESPPYRRLKQAGRASRAPLAEAFLRWGNARLVITVLFGLVAGQAVVWYTGQFQALFFLTLVLKLDETTASLLSASALALGAPLILAFGALSDRVGRKPIIVAGLVLAAASTFALFGALAAAADPALLDKPRVVLLLVLLFLPVAMVYGPIAALLVETFPTRVRCTSVSLPYHLGNGWFGGLVPAVSYAIGERTGRMLDGLWYPVAVAAATAAIALLFVRETKGKDIYAEDS